MVNLGENVIKYDPTDNYSGIFSFLSNIKEKLNIDDLFKISSVDYWVGNDFCHLSVKGQPPSCLVDGTYNTAWRNNIKENNYFDISFISNRFQIKTLIVRSICNFAQSIILKGSNDGVSWQTFFNEDVPVKNNADIKVDINCHTPYRFIRFTSESSYIHLSRIELYGTLNPRDKCTVNCKRSFKISSLHFEYQ